MNAGIILMHGKKFDEIDIQLLQCLQEHGRIKRNDLAEKAKLSIPSVSERLHKFEENGIIRNYNCVLNARKIGLQVTAFIFLVCESSNFYGKIIELASRKIEIQECQAITGEGSHLLKVRVENTQALVKIVI
jgi:Lrp/AsnC family leucine-responsive transcriptional regulator